MMRNRSIFWPLVMIASGVLWFLVALGTLPAANLWAVLNFVPYLLMGVGIGLLLRARWQLAGQIVSIVVVAAAVLAVVFAPQMRWNKPPDWGCNWSTSPFVNCSFNLDSGGSIPGSGRVVTESRQVADFTSVSVDYPAEVVIQQGAAQSASVQADDNLLPQLNLRVAGGVLHIENREPSYSRRVSPTRTVHITLTVKDLNEVDLPSAGTVSVGSLQTDHLTVSVSGAGTINLSKLDVQNLTVDLSGAGTVNADGKAANLKMDLSGLGSFKAADLAVGSANVDLSGVGSATVWVQNDLSANVSGTGSVSYYGSPSVNQNVSGLGSIQSLGRK
jgi:hypothetical protein